LIATPQKIMVVIDPTTHAQPALVKATQLAVRSGASLELYVCDIEQDIPESWAGGASAAEYRELSRLRRLDELFALAEPLRGRGLKVTTVCEWHAPLEQGIGHHVIRTAPDLVVKDTHRYPPMPRAMLTRTDWNLIRQVPAPLLLVRARPWPVPPRIGAAVDPCHPADRPVALDEAITRAGRALADTLDGVLDVYHVLQTPPHLPGEAVPDEERVRAHGEACAAVERLAARVAATARFDAGPVVEGLTRAAQTYVPDVLVVGAVARSRSGHSAASGTAVRLLERTDCDLMVVKPPGFVSPLLVTDE
jgi:universal stress protein E